MLRLTTVLWSLDANNSRPTSTERFRSDLVDLDHRLVPAATSATDDEGGGHDDPRRCGDKHRFVLDGLGGVLDGTDELLRLALDVIPADCQPRSSIR